MTFGERLKLLRKEKDLTQAELGKYFNLGKTAISLYETNRRFPDKEILEKMATFFDCSLDYLLGRLDIKISHDIGTKEITEEMVQKELEKRGLLKDTDIQVAFSSGFNGLNEENKKTAMDIIAGLKAKQDMEEK